MLLLVLLLVLLQYVGCAYWHQPSRRRVRPTPAAPASPIRQTTNSHQHSCCSSLGCLTFCKCPTSI
jgi:hypothetical protein